MNQKRKPKRAPKRRNRIFQDKMKKPIYKIFTLSIFIFMVFSCSGESPPTVTPKIKVPQPVSKKLEPSKVVAEKKESEKKEEKIYTYNPAGKPDPFKPFLQLTPVKTTSRRTPLTPLQKYDISQLKLVAIINTTEGNIAMVEDSSGKGYFLKKGTYIGKNDGRVKKISSDQVIIEEFYQDVLGQIKSSEISLFLHKAEEGGES